YISNHNNYHIEHHSYPNVCAHNLKIVNEKKSGEYYTENSYIEAMKNVISGIRNEKSAEDKVIAKVAKQD
ncbi:hypothetical protein J1785_03200, partial [Rahnella sp. SL6]